MGSTYLQLSPGDAPPPLTCKPFRAVIVSDVEVTQEWRNRVASWLVTSGCLYVVAWGAECENWHDTVDWANLKQFDFNDIPDAELVMTTWHENEPLTEAMWFAGHCATHPHIDLADTVIVHIANQPREAEMLEMYSAGEAVCSDE